MSLIGVKKKIEAVRSIGFSVSVVDFEGCLLDNREKELRCFIHRNRDFLEFRKYYTLNNGNRFVSRFSCAYHFLKDNEDPIEIILFHIEKTYQKRTNL